METTEIPKPLPDDLAKLFANLPSALPSDPEQDAKEAKWEQERQEAEDRQRQDKIQTRLARSGVPRRHWDFIPEKSGPWYDAYSSLKGQLGKGFLMVAMGNRGTGKTQLGTCLIGAACHQERTGRYVKAIDIFIALRESFRKDGITESQVVDQFVKPDLLVIDALEERGETTFEDRLLNHIIDKRYDNMADTLLITNQTADAFAESAGPSIISRIHETGNKIVCDWESFRKPQAKPETRVNNSLPVGDR